jgi:hypothetical protein
MYARLLKSNALFKWLMVEFQQIYCIINLNFPLKIIANLEEDFSKIRKCSILSITSLLHVTREFPSPLLIKHISLQENFQYNALQLKANVSYSYNT